MEIEFALENGVGIFTLQGPLDYSSTLRLMEAVNSRISPACRCFLLDMDAVEQVNSAAASILEIMFSEARKSDVRIGFYNVHGLSREVLEHFPHLQNGNCFATKEEAFHAVKSTS